MVLYEHNGKIPRQQIDSEAIMNIFGIVEIMNDFPELGELKSPPQMSQQTFEIWFINDVENHVAALVAERLKSNLIRSISNLHGDQLADLQEFIAQASNETATFEDLSKGDYIHIEIKKREYWIFNLHFRCSGLGVGFLFSSSFRNISNWSSES